MSRLVDYIIDDVREQTENEEFSDTYGIEDSEFLRFLNDAQYRIHALIVQKHPQVFVSEQVYTVVNNQSTYSLPSNIYLKNKVTEVEHSYDSDVENFMPLKPTVLVNRRPNLEGDPEFYIRKSNSIIITPIPNSGSATLRVSYVKKIDALDKRRGKVLTSTLDSSALTVTALTLDTTTFDNDTTQLNKSSYFCIVDKDGEIKMRNVKFSSIDSGTGVVTIDSSFVYVSGESISVGDYLVSGQNATTHSELPDSIERYLISYANWKILKRDSSIDSQDAVQELAQMEFEIVASYSDISDDIMEIPNINNDDWGF